MCYIWMCYYVIVLFPWIIFYNVIFSCVIYTCVIWSCYFFWLFFTMLFSECYSDVFVLSREKESRFIHKWNKFYFVIYEPFCSTCQENEMDFRFELALNIKKQDLTTSLHKKRNYFSKIYDFSFSVQKPLTIFGIEYNLW